MLHENSLLIGVFIVVLEIELRALVLSYIPSPNLFIYI